MQNDYEVVDSEKVSDKGIVVEEIKEKVTKNGKKKMNPVLEWLLIIVVALAIALFINFVIIINSVVPSGSMEPTIMTHSRMMGLRVLYWFNDPDRGDIVVFKYPDNPKENFVKRVIGLPGDVVDIKAEIVKDGDSEKLVGVTYINGERLDEPYIKEPMRAPSKELHYEVPDGCYFMMGDNRNNSNDSRFWKNTFVTRDAVLGKALFCYWPINRIGVLK